MGDDSGGIPSNIAAGPLNCPCDGGDDLGRLFCLLIWAAGIPRLFGHGAILGAHCVTTLENPTQCYEPGNVRYREFLRSQEMPEEFIELHRKTTLPIVWVPLDTAASALAIERAIVCMRRHARNARI